VNWFAITIIAIWLSSAIAVYFSKDSGVMVLSLLATIAMGFGYFLLHGKI